MSRLLIPETLLLKIKGQLKGHGSMTFRLGFDLSCSPYYLLLNSLSRPTWIRIRSSLLLLGVIVRGELSNGVIAMGGGG